MKSKSVTAAAVVAAALLGACGRTPTAPDLQPSVRADGGTGMFGSGGATPTPNRQSPYSHVRADGNGQFGSGGFAPPPDSTQGGGH